MSIQGKYRRVLGFVPELTRTIPTPIEFLTYPSLPIDLPVTVSKLSIAK